MKINLLIISIFLSILVFANINYLHGISGMTKKDGGIGCECHSFEANDSVNVWIEGPDSVYTNDSAYYKIYMTCGTAVVGGFDLAVFYGTLNSIDTLTHIISEDLTHTLPRPFINDTVVWDFQYLAPDSVLNDTLYLTGNSCNGDSIPTSLDQWNHGENFVVNVIEEPVFVENETIKPEDFVLYQNYPNPFNPSTKIRFTISDLPAGRQDLRSTILKVYDVLGKEMATLVNKELPAGEYEVLFNGSRLTSGIYFYKLQSGSFEKTMKMLLSK